MSATKITFPLIVDQNLVHDHMTLFMTSERISLKTAYNNMALSLKMRDRNYLCFLGNILNNILHRGGVRGFIKQYWLSGADSNNFINPRSLPGAPQNLSPRGHKASTFCRRGRLNCEDRDCKDSCGTYQVFFFCWYAGLVLLRAWLILL